MYRLIAIASLIYLSGCSEKPRSARQAETARTTPRPSASSAEALAAKRVAEQYFDLLRARNYSTAWSLWVGDAAGGREAFIAASKVRGSFDGRAGEPSAIREADGMRYILIEATGRSIAPNGKAVDQAGVVMLKRPAARRGDWRIWGADIRQRHCPKGQVVKALGCVDT